MNLGLSSKCRHREVEIVRHKYTSMQLGCWSSTIPGCPGKQYRHVGAVVAMGGIVAVGGRRGHGGYRSCGGGLSWLWGPKLSTHKHFLIAFNTPFTGEIWWDLFSGGHP